MISKDARKKALKMWRTPAIIFAVWLFLLGSLLLLTRTNKIISIAGSSMQPTFRTGDVVTSFQNNEICRGAIVIALEPKGEKIIKRVIAMEGDTIQIVNGSVILNGEALDEPYLAEHRNTQQCPEITVPEGYVYIMGDNRNESYDSRYFGCISIEDNILAVIDQQR